MDFFTTKAVDLAVGDKINVILLDQLLSKLPLPGFLQNIKKVLVLYVAKASDDTQFDAWQKNDQLFLTIPLNYEEVLKSTEEEVNTIALQKYQEHLGQLKADTLDLEQEQNLPSLLQYLTDHEIDYLHYDIESLLAAIETYRQTIGNSDYLSDQIQSFLNHLEAEQGETYALRVSKELLALMARPDVI